MTNDRHQEIARPRGPLDTCFHEAGHAVIATLNGVPVGYIDVWNIPYKGMQGQVRFDPHSPPKAWKDGYMGPSSWIFIYLAGAIAKVMFSTGLEYQLPNGEVDPQFRRALAHQFNNTASEDWQRAYSMLVDLDEYDEEYTLENAVEKVIYRVACSLKAHWEMVSELAYLLRTRGSMTFFEHPFLVGDDPARQRRAAYHHELRARIKARTQDGATQCCC